MPAATIRFHDSLLIFLGPQARDRGEVEIDVNEPRGVVDAIQAAGVPHTEVDLIVVNGRRVGFEHRLRPGDRVEVFGLDRPPDLEGTPDPAAASELAAAPDPGGLIPDPPRPLRFVLDGHLGRLARYLRMLGFDSRYDRLADDDELARISAAEDRILLTRDRGLLKRSIVRLGYLVRSDLPRDQLAEVAARYQLAPQAQPFSRCIRCNGDIRPVEVADVRAELADQPRTLKYFEQFGRCASCGAVYWPGSHFDRMSLLAQNVLGRPFVPVRPIGENQSDRS